MFNVMDVKAPFLRVRETYSGLHNCGRCKTVQKPLQILGKIQVKFKISGNTAKKIDKIEK